MRRRLENSIRTAAAEWADDNRRHRLPHFDRDRKGRINRLNARACEMSGQTYGVNLGATIASIGSGEPWPTAMSIKSEVARFSKCVTKQVFDADSGHTWDITVTPLPPPESHGDPGRRYDRFLLMARDVSRIVSLQESLRRTATMAEMGALVGGVAHEVRNPLFGMSATLDAFDARFGEDLQQAPYLRMLRGEVERMTDLMRELLEYGRPLGPTLTVEPLTGSSGRR